MIVIRTLFGALLAVIGFAQAQAAQDPQTVMALRVIDNYLVPRYVTFESAAKDDADAWKSFCAGTRADKTALVAAFHATSDAWQTVDHIRTGPVSTFLRAERISYWPEMRNATGKGVAALLADTDAHDLDPATFADGSVAVQGLPALERLLFETTDVATPRACALGQAIAVNLADIAHSIVADWTAPQGPRNALAKGTHGPGTFTDGAEASRLLLTDLMTSYQRMLDIKLLAVLGASADEAKPKAAENWRSAGGARNLGINLDSTRAMIGVFAKDIDPAARANVTKAMADAKSAVDALPAELGAAAADAATRKALEKAAAAIKTARDAARATLPAQLNITLGFNALDGD